jgi:hypothetical protein
MTSHSTVCWSLLPEDIWLHLLDFVDDWESLVAWRDALVQAGKTEAALQFQSTLGLYMRGTYRSPASLLQISFEDLPDIRSLVPITTLDPHCILSSDGFHSSCLTQSYSLPWVRGCFILTLNWITIWTYLLYHWQTQLETEMRAADSELARAFSRIWPALTCQPTIDPDLLPEATVERIEPTTVFTGYLPMTDSQCAQLKQLLTRYRVPDSLSHALDRLVRYRERYETAWTVCVQQTLYFSEASIEAMVSRLFVNPLLLAHRRMDRPRLSFLSYMQRQDDALVWIDYLQKKGYVFETYRSLLASFLLDLPVTPRVDGLLRLPAESTVCMNTFIDAAQHCKETVPSDPSCLPALLLKLLRKDYTHRGLTPKTDGVFKIALSVLLSQRRSQIIRQCLLQTRDTFREICNHYFASWIYWLGQYFNELPELAESLHCFPQHPPSDELSDLSDLESDDSWY